jgi:hypothetical protein
MFDRNISDVICLGNYSSSKAKAFVFISSCHILNIKECAILDNMKGMGGAFRFWNYNTLGGNKCVSFQIIVETDSSNGQKLMCIAMYLYIYRYI